MNEGTENGIFENNKKKKDFRGNLCNLVVIKGVEQILQFSASIYSTYPQNSVSTSAHPQSVSTQDGTAHHKHPCFYA